MAITTRDGLIAAMGAGQGAQFMKPQISSAGGAFYCLFRVSGAPGAAAIPATASGNTCDRTTAGALLIPFPSATTYLTTFEASCTVPGVLRLSDRLVETGALSFITTTAQTINSVALPARATTALDVELWFEVHATGGAVASPTVTCTYTNQSGISGRTAVLDGGLPTSVGTQMQRSYPLSLQSGDTGVQSVQSFTSTTSTGAAGACGIVLRRRIAMGTVVAANLGFNEGYAETGLEKIPDLACLELLWLATGGNTGTVQGAIDIAQG